MRLNWGKIYKQANLIKFLLKVQRQLIHPILRTGSQLGWKKSWNRLTSCHSDYIWDIIAELLQYPSMQLKESWEVQTMVQWNRGLWQPAHLSTHCHALSKASPTVVGSHHKCGYGIYPGLKTFLGWLRETLHQWNLGINESCISVMIWWLAASEFNRLTEWPNCGLGIRGGVVEVSFHLLERRQVGEVATLSVPGLDWCELNLSSGTYS